MNIIQVDTGSEKSAVFQSAITDFTLELLLIDNEEDLVWRIAREMVGASGFDDCVIYLLNPKNGKMRQAAAIGEKNPTANEINNRLEIPIGEGVTGHVALTKEPIIVDDLSSDDRYITDQKQMQSEICVPILLDDDVIGLIDCEAPEKAYFGEAHLEYLIKIATITSVKLQRIREAKRSKQRAHELRKINKDLRKEVIKRKKTVESLQNSFTRFTDFSETATSWYWEQDAEFKFKEPSVFRADGAFEFLGQIVGRTRWDILGIDLTSDDNWLRHYEDYLAQRSFRDFRYEISDSSGEKFAFSVNGEPFYSDDGEFCGYRGTVTEITGLVKAYNSNARFLHALDQTSEGLLLWDPDGKLVLFNAGFKKMSGPYGEDLKIGMSYKDWLTNKVSRGLIPEAIGCEEEWLKVCFEKFLDPPTATEVFRQGRWYLHRLVKLLDGSTIQTIVDIHDLKLDRQRFELATMGAGVGIWEALPNGESSIWSDSYYAIYGLEPGEIEPSREHFLNSIHPDDRNEVARILKASDDDGEETAFECRIIRKDGSIAWVYSNGKLVSTGGVKRWFGTLVNIDAQKHAETAKNEFISTMNHELRTPLTAIIGLTELVLIGAYGELPPKVSEMLSISKKNSDQLLVLINDILEMDRLRVGKIEFNISNITSSEILNDAVTLNEHYANDFDIKIQIDQNSEDFSVMADARRVQQVLANLISNAIKFSSDGAVVEISGTQSDGYGVFSVKDYGLGIPDEFREKVFERFTQIDGSNTRKVGGSGLGLSIAKTIVEIQGGSIDYETEIGVGTTFTFTIPLAT